MLKKYTVVWSRRLIALTSVLGSCINVAIPFALAYLIDVRYTALWLLCRAGAQLFLAIFPNPLTVLLYVTKYNLIDRRKLIRRGYIFGLLPSLILAFVVIYVIDIPVEISDYSVLLVVYLVAFQLSGYEGVIARGLKRADFALKVTVLDLLFSFFMICVLVVYSDFKVFLIVAIVKEFSRWGYFSYLRRGVIGRANIKSKASFSKLSSSYIKIHISRATLQVISQHGDRILFPIFFGLHISGQAGLGSSLAMIVAIFSSSAFAWSMPKTLEGEDMSAWLLNEWSRLLVFTCAFSMAIFISFPWMVLLFSYFDFALPELTNIVVLGFLYSSLASLNFLGMGLSKERLKSFKHSLVCFISLFLTYAVVYIGSLIFSVDSYEYCIGVGVVVSSLVFFIVNFRFFSWRKIIPLQFMVVASVYVLL